MQSTLVTSAQAASAAPKTTLYVGGLDDSVTAATLHAAFIPFGDVKDVPLPLDPGTGSHRGFAFVEYENPADAAAAVENMNDAELLGRVLRVNLAQNKTGGLTGAWGDEEGG